MTVVSASDCAEDGDLLFRFAESREEPGGSTAAPADDGGGARLFLLPSAWLPLARAPPCAMEAEEVHSVMDHARCLQELFRESVKRKNQQLDLLQSEVRRLKTSVGVRDEAAGAQIDAALNAQAGELRRAKETVAARTAEVDALTRQVAQLKTELADERAKNTAARERAEVASSTQGALERREEEVEGLREELSQAQAAALRLQTASAEAEAALEARDAELAALRSQEDQSIKAVASGETVQAELEMLRSRSEEFEAVLAAERDARAAAESQAVDQQRGREELEAEREDLHREIEELRSANTSDGAESEMLDLRAQVGRTPPAAIRAPLPPAYHAPRRRSPRPPLMICSYACVPRTWTCMHDEGWAALTSVTPLPLARHRCKSCRKRSRKRKRPTTPAASQPGAHPTHPPTRPTHLPTPHATVHPLREGVTRAPSAHTGSRHPRRHPLARRPPTARERARTTSQRRPAPHPRAPHPRR